MKNQLQRVKKEVDQLRRETAFDQEENNKLRDVTNYTFRTYSLDCRTSESTNRRSKEIGRRQ